MKKFGRTQVGGRVRDIVSLPPATAGEAFDALHEAGFAQCGEIVVEEDDEDGSLYPPTRSLVRVGGALGNQAVIELVSHDEDNEAEVGFTCVHDVMKGVFYAKLAPRSSNVLDEDAQRVTKGAITTLIDVAEACASRKITLGLEQSLASHADLICSLLYLGFQVMPVRKSPLVGVALLMDLNIGWPSAGLTSSQTDNTCTGTSECSTNAQDDGLTYDDSDSD
jgi:hypothetical protein|mmetsp:Transcript_55205/g.87526  ORF Transcript_55205/g.87526 Transcript_55205/m.87526 type:complete len:222 (-) Transcript_55205:134-799(-)